MGFLNQLELGLGTWAWGDKMMWGFQKGYDAKDLREAFRASFQAGVRLIDTAEVYGGGRSESFLGEFLRENPHDKIHIATKFAPFPWRVSTSRLLKALKASLSRLGLDSVDLYQMHWPSSPRSIQAWMEPLAQAVKEGLAKEVGVSNYSRDMMLRAQEALAAHKIPLASNQMHFSLIHRKNELNGLLAECAKSGVRFIAYSPLGKGLLSGKYTSQNPPSGPRRLIFLNKLKPIQELVGTLKEIGQAHGGKTSNQVALNWVLRKGGLAIPGAKNAGQAKENAGGSGWRLTPAEVATLDEASGGF